MPLDELVQYAVLETEEEKLKFQEHQDQILNAIKIENQALKEAIVKKKNNKSKKSADSKEKVNNSKIWNQAYNWFIDRLVYTFLNRLFAIRVMEALDLLKESTLIPQLDLGNRSARMTKIQEKSPGKSINEWQVMVIKDAFLELTEDIRMIFDEEDIATRIWPDGDVIAQLITYFNDVNPEIYKKDDCIGWFYHYYVLKIRKGHKTMSSHGSKSPANPYYLSILNTVYTPRWMVQILVDNSLGHWWQDSHPESKIFSDSSYFIQKVPIKLEPSSNELLDLKILDPACGSGNFLVYTFTKLVQMYEENYPELDLCKIIKIILTQNLYGVDINRRPAQLSAIALYILAKCLIKEKAPEFSTTFKMPSVNIISCDIRIPKDDKNRILFLQKFKDVKVQKVLKDLIDQFDNADQLGSLIDIKSLQAEINKLKQDQEVKHKAKGSLDKFLPKEYLKSTLHEYSLNLVEIVENELISDESQNIGLQLFGKQAKNAASLAQILAQKYDVIISNPPFGLSMDVTKEKLKKFYPNTYGDLISAFVDQSLRLLKIKGFIGMVSDFSFLHLPKFEKFRSKILIKEAFIQYLLMIGYGSLPNAGNRPVLFILRKIAEDFSESEISEIGGLYRNPQYDINKSYSNEHYIHEIVHNIKEINLWDNTRKIPQGWNQINQNDFLNLPRSVIDLSIAEKFIPLLEFFTKYPRLDISQHNRTEKERLLNHEISRVFQGIATGNNDLFVRFWFEVKPDQIRKVEMINESSDVPNSVDKSFVPFSKGGGDIRYYLNNGYILWWNKNSIEEMKKQNCRLQNLSLIGKSNIHWSLSSGKPRGRFNISQIGLMSDVASMNIHMLDKELEKYTLLAYLNSKYGVFLGRLQTKDRKWQAGNIARFPIPIDFLINKSKLLSKLAKESYELLRDWDTGYPMSPLFSESLIDKVIENNQKTLNIGKPKTEHLFCEEYEQCKSDTSKLINQIVVNTEDISIKKLIDAVKQRFDIFTKRIDEIDDHINDILYDLIDDETSQALSDYYTKFIGNLGWNPEPEIWIKDFLMANIMKLIKSTSKRIILLNNFKENELGLYQILINNLSRKLDLNPHEIQLILKELEEILGKDLKRWITENFFFYHCQRFGGRPIIWQFSSKSKSNQDNAIDIFIDYHQINENTLPNIRVEYIEPLLKIYEQRKAIGTLPVEDIPKCDELEEFVRAFVALEKGYENIPNPNALTGKNTEKGKGDDKTWEWVFSQAELIIKNGYVPDHFKGVLINIIPLCIELSEAKKKEFPIEYYSICPKGALKQVLKKINALDQLKNSGKRIDVNEKNNNSELEV